MTRVEGYFLFSSTHLVERRALKKEATNECTGTWISTVFRTQFRLMDAQTKRYPDTVKVARATLPLQIQVVKTNGTNARAR